MPEWPTPAVTVTSVGTPTRSSVSTIASSIDAGIGDVALDVVRRPRCPSTTTSAPPRSFGGRRPRRRCRTAPPTTTWVVGSAGISSGRPARRWRRRACRGRRRRGRGAPCVGGVQLVEGAVHPVDGEVAREHAAVDAERLDGVLDPGREHVDASIEPSGMASPESLHTTWSPRPRARRCRPPRAPARRRRADRGQPACSTTTTRSSSRPAPVAAVVELVGVGHQLEEQAALLRARGARRRREAARPGAHRPHAPEPGRLHLLVESADRVGDGVGRREAADDRVGVPVGVGRAGRARASRRSSGAGRRGDVDELLDVPPGGLGAVGREVEAAGHPGHVAHVQLAAARTGTGTSRCGPGPRGGRGRRRCGTGAVIGPPSVSTLRSISRSGIVEPRGRAGPPNDDAAARAGVAAQPEPAVAGHELRAGQRRGSGCTRRWAASSPTWPSPLGLDADGERGDAVAGAPCGPRASCADGLRPAAPAGGGGVGQGDQPHRAVGAAGVVGGGPGPRRRRCGSPTMPACSASTRSHPAAAAAAGGRPASATTTASSGPSRSAVDASASAAAVEAGATIVADATACTHHEPPARP